MVETGMALALWPSPGYIPVYSCTNEFQGVFSADPGVLNSPGNPRGQKYTFSDEDGK